jgi:pyruvate formate lyase activating enzyme
MLIAGFQPFSLSDYPGKPAAIVFTQGCNYRCSFCHNRSLWPPNASYPPAATCAGVLKHLAARKDLLAGLVISGGEPTLHVGLPHFLADVKEMGMAVKLDTNGSRPDVIADLLKQSLVDYIAMDIKAPLDKYDMLCGLPVDTDAIRQSINIIASGNVSHHFRTTYYGPLLSQDDLSELKQLVPPQSAHLTQGYRHPPVE